MKKYSIPATLGLLAFLVIFVYFTFFRRVQGFCYHKIHSCHGYNPRWDFGPPSEEQEKLLDKIAAQPFTLLGSGKECYAFVSEDEEIIVKFFKQKHMKTEYLLNHIPLSQELRMIHNETLNRHRDKRARLYQSYQIAYERLPQETAVLYLHLTKTDYLKRTIILMTPKGEKLILKLDDLEFLVQKRVRHIFDYLTVHPEQGKAVICSILDLIVSRSKQGIGDNDINCERNLGLLDGKAVQIDIGEFFPAFPALPSREELITATLDLKAFLEFHNPQLIPFLDQQIEARANSAELSNE